MRTMQRRTVCSICLYVPFGSLLHTSLAIGNPFTGEKAYGKYLDLYANHTAYNNLRRVPTVPRRSDLCSERRVHNELPRKCRTTKDYEKYAK